uniref:BHLH domain-containing protein n=1 Tax=Opuntia streptacantha TaxID=393608 RepID=A0A7C9AB72_OPUST
MDTDWPQGAINSYNGELGMMNMEDSMPFLQMLHSVESQIPFPYPLTQEPNFQLLRLPLQKLMMKPLEEDRIVSSVTNNTSIVMESESCRIDNAVSEINQGTPRVGRSARKMIIGPNKERRKRKTPSTRRMKNNEEVESRRMAHIAVERNRRRQMSEHLDVLHSLLPPSYVQRGIKHQ